MPTYIAPGLTERVHEMRGRTLDFIGHGVSPQAEAGATAPWSVKGA